MKLWRRTTMNDKLRTVLKKRYEADIEDAKYKIKCFSRQKSYNKRINKSS